LIDIKNAIDTEPFSEAPNTSQNAIFIGYILVRKGCTDLSDTTGTNAVLVQGGLFRNVGGNGGSGTAAATSLGSLSDVSLTNVSKGDLLVYGAAGDSQWNNAKQLTGSYGLTGSLTVANGSLTIGSITGSQTTENTLNVYAPGFNTNGEGGQILLAAMPSASSYTSASMLDNYQDTFRILRGTNAGGSNTSLFTLNLTTGNTLFTGAVTASAYSGLPNAWLHALRSGAQTIGSGTWASRDIIFNNYSSNNFTYDSSTGIATLKAGKTYRITARLAWAAAGLYTLKFGVYNQTTSGFTGPTVEMIQSPNGTYNVSDATLEHIFNVGASDVNISIRTTSDTNALTGESIRGDLNTQLIIQQIA
jgi:hypothetical protein